MLRWVTMVAVLKFSLPLAFLAAVPAGYALGGAWAFLAVGVIPLALGVLDEALGSDDGACADRQSTAFRMLAWSYIPLQLLTTVWAASAIATAGAGAVEAIGLTLSVGMTGGIFGMLAAHEMVHSTSRYERAAGLAMLASTLYMHFRIAHVHGHHTRGATPQDPATARRGESAYGFVLRSVPGQLREAWDFETARLARSGRGRCDVSNRMLHYALLQALILLVAASFGWSVLAFFLCQSAMAVFLLELFNYIAHYGLVRARLADGRWEPLTARHAWNSSRRMNNWTLFNMGRHSDHHRHATRAYQTLQPVPQEPELPSGYAAAILLALVPPLWRRAMDGRVLAICPEDDRGAEEYGSQLHGSEARGQRRSGLSRYSA